VKPGKLWRRDEGGRRIHDPNSEESFAETSRESFFLQVFPSRMIDFRIGVSPLGPTSAVSYPVGMVITGSCG
jgi:hypothetical protein